MSGGAALLVLAQAVTSPAPAVERAIVVAGPGRVGARLDGGVYEAAREDLGDLRVLDDGGRLVPFLLDRGRAPSPASDLQADVRNRSWRPDGAATAVLDFGGRLRKRTLQLTLSGDNFRRRVSVEGAEAGDEWATMVDEAWVFAVPGPAPARYETLALPENDFPLLRVVVHPGEGERERVLVRAARVPVSLEPPQRERVESPRWARAEDPASRETWLTVDLGARHQPFHAIDLDVADGRFFREARVEARRDPPAGSSNLWWADLGGGAVYRLEHGGRQRECLRVPVCGRERVLRLRLRNGDDRPLTIRGLAVRTPVERVVFEAAAGRSYRLAYGSPGETSPSFDLARTVGDPAAWVAAAGEVPLGPARRGPNAAASPPWTERHPLLLWAGLLAVVAALALLTLRALRGAE